MFWKITEEIINIAKQIPRKDNKNRIWGLNWAQFQAFQAKSEFSRKIQKEEPVLWRQKINLRFQMRIQ